MELKGKVMIMKIMTKIEIINQSNRTIEQLRAHYEIEKVLANRLKHSSKEERKYLYTELYDELFRKVPDHPQLTTKTDMASSVKRVTNEISLLKPFITNKEITFLEIGPGDCALSFEVAKYVKMVIAVDISKEIVKNKFKPPNFELIISDGSSIDIVSNTVEVAYSNQLMEHIHPDDAIIQLQNIHRVLNPGGFYICITPHRYSGPHDISKYFDDVATGFHLKEYTYSELNSMFRSVGFSKIDVLLSYGRFNLKVPVWPFTVLETGINILPKKIKLKLSHTSLFQFFLGIKIVATKENHERTWRGKYERASERLSRFWRDVERAWSTSRRCARSRSERAHRGRQPAPRCDGRSYERSAYIHFQIVLIVVHGTC